MVHELETVLVVALLAVVVELVNAPGEVDKWLEQLDVEVFVELGLLAVEVTVVKDGVVEVLHDELLAFEIVVVDVELVLCALVVQEVVLGNA